MGTTGGNGAAGRLADKSYVIVALPPKDDPIHSLSTDKKPHLTLLYLGPHLENPGRLESFLRNAAQSLPEFYLTVKERGSLGPDKADVLFFNKHRLSPVENFRSHLRSNPEIEKAYLSTEQYPEWVPHLTLRYPETPVRSDVNGLYPPVIFNRLALWSGDSEGPEFPLRPEFATMAQSSILQAEDFLAHFGIKGMKWGVRKGDAPGVSSRTNREARKDAQEFARARMFFGEGAGTRRKLIKAKVEGKSRNDPNYKKAFDHHSATQDMSQHAEKARSERRRKDVKNTTLKTGRGISHLLRGNSQYASALASGVFAAGMAAHKAGIDRLLLDAGKKTVREIRRGAQSPAAREFLRKMGSMV